MYLSAKALKGKSTRFQGCISGYVTDKSTGKGIVGAKIEYLPPSGWTVSIPCSEPPDSAAYIAVGLEPVTYTVTARAKGYKPKSHQVKVIGSDIVTQNFLLEKISSP